MVETPESKEVSTDSNAIQGKERQIGLNISYVPKGTKVFTFVDSADRPGGGYYTDSGFTINAGMLADPSAIKVISIIGTLDGRKPNTFLLVDARLLGNQRGTFVIHLSHLVFPDEQTYQNFVKKYQNTTSSQLPSNLNEWKRKYNS